MILKTKSIKTLPTNLIKYVMRPEKLKGHGRESVIVQRNLRSKKFEGYSREFELNHMMRHHSRKNGVVAFHTVLAFSPLDTKNISPQAVRDISHKFMQLRGKGALYLSVEHRNEEHIHMHVIHSNFSMQGKGLRQSKAELSQLKTDLAIYVQQRFPEIQHTFFGHGKQKTINEKVLEKNINRRTLDKDHISDLLSKEFTNAHSIDEFVSNVEAKGLPVYLRNGRLQGVMFKGLKHRFSKFGIDNDSFQKLEEIHRVEQKLLDEFEEIRSSKGKGRDFGDKEIDEEDFVLSRDDPDSESNESDEDEQKDTQGDNNENEEIDSTEDENTDDEDDEKNDDDDYE